MYVYKGHQFKAVDDSEIPSDTLIEIVQHANVYNKWGYNKYKVYSGMESGSIGEVCKSINTMCLINIKTSTWS